MIYEPVVITNPSVVQIDESARVDSFVKIEGGLGVTIGKGVHISSFAHINIGGGKLTVGDYVAITSGAKILSGSNTMRGQSMSSAAPRELQVVKRLETIIEDFAMIACNAVVLPGVRVGRYAVVGAGVVVDRDVPDYAILKPAPPMRVGRRQDVSGWDYE